MIHGRQTLAFPESAFSSVNRKTKRVLPPNSCFSGSCLLAFHNAQTTMQGLGKFGAGTANAHTREAWGIILAFSLKPLNRSIIKGGPVN